MEQALLWIRGGAVGYERREAANWNGGLRNKVIILVSPIRICISTNVEFVRSRASCPIYYYLG